MIIRVSRARKYPASHHALERCHWQINVPWDSLKYLKIKESV